MATRGWSRGQGCAVLAVVGAVLLSGTGCSAALDRAQSLDTSLASVAGVDDAEVQPATADRVGRIGITLDLGLDATSTLRTVRRIDDTAREAGFTTYMLELSRTIAAEDLLVVADTFASDPAAEGVLSDWIRVLDALLGEVTYEYDAGAASITSVSDGGIVHDVAEASRIGSGDQHTTWRFEADSSAFVVSGAVNQRDVTLFNRVQRTVSSTVLPVPATRWELHRSGGQVALDLEVRLAGGAEPQRLTLERWGTSLRPLAVAATDATAYPRLPRRVQLSDVTETGRDTFAAWASDADPVRGRDRYSRGWDLWWQRLVDRSE